ncbi:MAG: MFS transporter [Chloroflexota bacterium]|nr:MFS transporter [Chloroflexota bacterium]
MTILRNRGFLLLWGGQLFSTVGIWSLRTVLLIWVYNTVRTGTAVSLVGLAEVIPLLIVAPLGGVLIDRWPRVFFMAGGMGAAVLFLFPLLAVSGDAVLPAVVAVALLINAAVQLSYNAASAAVPVVVGQDGLGQANSLISFLNGGVAVVGPGLAAFLEAALGPHGALVVVAAIIVPAVPLYLMAPAPRAVRAEEVGSMGRELLDGLSYVIHSRMLLSLTALITVAGLGFGGLSVLDVVFVTRALKLPSSNVGLLLSSAGLGELLGGIVMVAIAGRIAHWYHRVLGFCVILAGGALVVYSSSHSLVAAVGALAVASLFFPPLIVAFTTLQQRVTTDAFMGRVSSTLSTTMAISMLVSLAIVGALTDLFGVRIVIAAAGVILLFSGVLSLFLIRETPPPREETNAAAA